jgi:hypothetical protein
VLLAPVHEVGIGRQPKRLLCQIEVLNIRHSDFVCVAGFRISTALVAAVQ